MKKVLFIIPSYNVGGTSTSMRSIVYCLSGSYDISVYGVSHRSDNIQPIGQVKEIQSGFCMECLHTKVTKSISCKNISVALIKSLSKLFRIDRRIVRKEAIRISNMKFDSVIGFEESPLVLRILSLVTNKNKIAWIHCDYTRLFDSMDNTIFDTINRIVCVSDYTKERFDDLLPNLSLRTISINNLLNVNLILSKSREKPDFYFDEDAFNIVSVGRLDPIKNFSIIPKILSEVESMTSQLINWYIIGDYDVPGEKERIQNEILKCQIDQRVRLLGVQPNPYKYISRADIVVSTSLSEACPYVINESKVIGTPVVCNNFGSASEFIEDGKTGFICENSNMAQLIANLVNNREQLLSIRDYLKNYEYPNSKIIQQITEIL